MRIRRLLGVVASLTLLIGVVLTGIGLRAVPAGAALSQSEKVALVPSAQGQEGNGGELPTAGFPNGYAPQFTEVLPTEIANAASDPLTAFDTVALVQICDIGDYLAMPTFKSRLESFVANGGKLIIWDSECESTDYSKFVFPFTTSNPGAAGAEGSLTDAEDNRLSSTTAGSPYFVDLNLVASDTDAVGDANVFVSFDPHWFVDLVGTNTLGVNGPVQAYAFHQNGIIIYSGLDMDVTDQSAGFDPASTSGDTHLNRIWLNQLLLPFAADALPGGVKVFGLVLSPVSATAEVPASHTVTALLTSNGAPQPDVTVTFNVTAGPHKGATGTAKTDSAGKASFTYPGSTAGTDTIEASATLLGAGEQQVPVSGQASMVWTAPPAPTTTTTVAPTTTTTAPVTTTTAAPATTTTVAPAQVLAEQVARPVAQLPATGAERTGGLVRTGAALVAVGLLLLGGSWLAGRRES